MRSRAARHCEQSSAGRTGWTGRTGNGDGSNGDGDGSGWPVAVPRGRRRTRLFCGAGTRGTRCHYRPPGWPGQPRCCPGLALSADEGLTSSPPSPRATPTRRALLGGYSSASAHPRIHASTHPRINLDAVAVAAVASPVRPPPVGPRACVTRHARTSATSSSRNLHPSRFLHSSTPPPSRRCAIGREGPGELSPPPPPPPADYARLEPRLAVQHDAASRGPTSRLVELRVPSVL
jgi:hypothetical protein